MAYSKTNRFYLPEADNLPCLLGIKLPVHKRGAIRSNFSLKKLAYLGVIKSAATRASLFRLVKPNQSPTSSGSMTGTKDTSDFYQSRNGVHC